ncbi:MAG: hypothetical protein ACXVXN_09180 [Mycobacteriaceae bacterium]
MHRRRRGELSAGQHRIRRIGGGRRASGAQLGQSQAEAQFLSGSLLNGVMPFGNLLATLCGLPIINRPNRISVNLGTGITCGLADQSAQASPGGSAHPRVGSAHRLGGLR